MNGTCFSIYGAVHGSLLNIAPSINQLHSNANSHRPTEETTPNPLADSSIASPVDPDTPITPLTDEQPTVGDTDEDEDGVGDQVNWSDISTTASDDGVGVYDEDAEDPNYDPELLGAPLTAEEKDAALKSWFASEVAYESDNDAGIADLDRPQDAAMSYTILDTQEITHPKASQSPAILAPFYGFPDAASFEAWISTDPNVQEAMAPLLKFCNKKRATLGRGKAMPPVTLEKALETISLNETSARKNFTINREAASKNWKDEEYHGCALYNLMFHLCQLETGRFAFKNWKNPIKWNRCWFLLRRMKRRDEKQREKPEVSEKAMAKWVHDGMKKDGVEFSANLEATKRKAGKARSKAMKKVQKLERRQKVAAAASGVVKPPRTSKGKGKGKAEDQSKDDAEELDEEKLDEIEYYRAQAERYRVQMELLSDKRMLRTLEKLQKQKPGPANLGSGELAHMKEILSNSAFDLEEMDSTFLTDKLSIHLPQLKEGTQFHKRLNEEDTNANFEKMLTRSTLAKKNKTEDPNPGLLEAMKAIMMVLHPEEYEKHILYNKDITARQIEDARFDIANANLEESIDLATEGDQMMSTLQEIVDKRKKAGKGSPNFNHRKVKNIVSLLTNTKWENSDFLAACRRLRVNPGAPIRLPGMREGGAHLYWFQVCAIFGMMEKLDAGLVDGVILAAVVGLGKTITMLAYILIVSFTSFH